jgi:TIR domain/Restriction endonuclease
MAPKLYLLEADGRDERPGLFLSYARPDEQIAQELAARLEDAGFAPWLDTRHAAGAKPIRRKIQGALPPTRFFVILITQHSVDSSWVLGELTEAMRPKYRARGVPVVPVLAGDVEPPAEFRSMQMVPLTSDDGKIGTPLVEALQSLVAVNLAALRPTETESLVAELLPRLGFERVEKDSRKMDLRVDFTGRFTLPDPFGPAREETWVFEVKHHRVSTSMIATFAGRLMFMPKSQRGAILTTDTLTSAAREFVDHVNRERSLMLRVIEGDELRRLVARYPDLVAKYFSPPDAAG